jgi:regulatory protein
MLLESVETGASGIAKIAAGGLSLFVRVEFWEALGREAGRLVAGAEIDGEEEGDLVLAAKATEAEARGASLLARAEQPRFLLRGKLIERGYPERAVALALERLESEGFLSDRRYAEAWLRSRVDRSIHGRGGRPEGPSSLLLSLRARSVPEEVAKAALAAVLDVERRPALLEAALRRVETLLAESPSAKTYRRPEGDELRGELRSLGWGGEEIRDMMEGRRSDP